MSAATRAVDNDAPRSVGCRMPAIIFSSVDLPEPLLPMTPNASPRARRSNEMILECRDRVLGPQTLAVRLRSSSALLSVRSWKPGGVAAVELR